MKYARRRDKSEPLIIAALEAVGASVQRLDLDGGPDLLVGFRSVNYLIECKTEHGKPGAGMKRTDSGVSIEQQLWQLKWNGARVAVVCNGDEALRAIGARQ